MADTRGEIKGLLCTSDMLSFTHQRRDDSPSISSLDKCLLSVLCSSVFHMNPPQVRFLDVLTGSDPVFSPTCFVLL